MKIIVKNGFAFRVPQETILRYRANCSKEWGCFVTGDTKGLSCSKAEKAGLTRGTWVEMAICRIDPTKILSFKPHYLNEAFTQVWGFPTAGEIKDEFPPNATRLIAFLLHRQSKDRLRGILELAADEAFKQWVSQGMQGEETHCQQLSRKLLISTSATFSGSRCLRQLENMAIITLSQLRCDRRKLI